MTTHSVRRAAATVVAALVGLFTLLALAPSALAAAPPDPNTIVAGWKDSKDHLYVGPGVTLSSDQLSGIRDALKGADSQIYVAALADGSVTSNSAAGNVISALGQALAREGKNRVTVAILDGNSLFAGSSAIRRTGLAGDLAEAAVANNKDVVSGMEDFVHRVDKAVSGDTRGALKTGSSAGGGGGAGVLIGILVLAVVGGLGIFLISRKKKRDRERREAAELAAVKQTVEEDVTKFGEEITALDLDVKVAGTRAADQDDWRQALDSYERAKAELAAVKRVDELRGVTTALEEGRYALACVNARVNNQPVPERRAPCFFNPQHGPSARDVRWAPPGGAPRDVPACADDARRVEQGFDPQMREVMIDGQRRPYWDAGPAYAPYASGYYGGFGGDLMTGMLIGTVLGSSFGGWGMHGGYGAGYDAGYAQGAESGAGDFGGGGDWGGGGGDFGGGDFGGGDFGGGDW
ncbi:hypothetical protein Ssi03_06310 [Sphaerisporangium siamense]|uniref:Putative lipid-binding transport protein (Tim44 family) n=1 Tax=Sphaerisporangium siamense TaxID=795645 RepID=A0A7W7DIH1_9ACTN|nr:hypothetical protein [Sphaerisporangium siamense]MBB4705963.1 putative lipid-binding transport protein (Tim44 family) [Sphaerisporangium siamense]GII82641.1 hypothetical protein Ssi03_06310 [Sphaerisporangium siamense]